MELARCLTGWSVKEQFWRGQFTFHADLHDEGSKRVLGIEIASGGHQEAEQVVEMLATHKSRARFLVHKVARHCLGDYRDVLGELCSKRLKNGALTRFFQAIQ